MTEKARLTETYLDGGVESMRDCIRELRHVVDHETARAIRERCKDKLTKAARIFKELREESEELRNAITGLEEEIAGLKVADDDLQELIEKVYDVERRIITGRELINFVKEKWQR